MRCMGVFPESLETPATLLMYIFSKLVFGIHTAESTKIEQIKCKWMGNLFNAKIIVFQ